MRIMKIILWQESLNLLDISARDKKAILGYTEEIIKDFKDSKDQILVQEFISKPQISGVIFTRDINTNSPYLHN